jgi:hypothetical protein
VLKRRVTDKAPFNARPEQQAVSAGSTVSIWPVNRCGIMKRNAQFSDRLIYFTGNSAIGSRQVYKPNVTEVTGA